MSSRGAAGRRWAGRLGLLAAGTALGLLTVEAVARWFFPGCFIYGQSQFVADPQLGWRHRPLARYEVGRFGDYFVEVRINAAGYRDRERHPDRIPGKRRLVVIGDSFVEGFGVEASAVFTALLEGRHPDLEVLNLGVSGYETGQELMLLTDALAYRPDAILVALYPENDIVELSDVNRFAAFPKGRFELRDDRLAFTPPPPAPDPPAPAPPAAGPKAFLQRHSFGYHLARNGYARLLAAAGRRARPVPPVTENLVRVFLRDRPPELAANIALFRRLVAEMDAAGRAAGVPIRFLVIPSRVEVHDGDWDRALAGQPASAYVRGALRALTAELAAAGAVVLDPGDRFRELGSRERLYFDHDGHLNPAGHRALADYLDAALAAGKVP